METRPAELSSVRVVSVSASPRTALGRMLLFAGVLVLGAAALVVVIPLILLLLVLGALGLLAMRLWMLLLVLTGRSDAQGRRNVRVVRRDPPGA